MVNRISRKRIIIYPYKMGSASAKALQEKLLGSNIPVKRVKPDGNYRPRATDLIINWGSSIIPNWNFLGLGIQNSMYYVKDASNKLTTFNALYEAEIPTPDFTTDREEAIDWVNAGFTVLARHKLNGHSGEGITIHKENDIGFAPLYVKYKKKRNEYRVHVFNGTVLSVQEKRRDSEVERDEDQRMIRNHDNGWVFCREDVTVTPELENIAKDAVNALGLDFGAVDVIYNQKENAYYVLEVNTAPGLQGTTLDEYADAIINLYNNN